MKLRANDFQVRLLAWYGRCRRDLPWRVNPRVSPSALPDPYHVLVSEVMLQQTQVSTVVDYFRRFMERFPTLFSLAEANEQDILRLWQGLGYYSRARHLRATAKIIVERFGGKIPSQVQELLSLPGVGRYTAGAIASLAFDQRAAILDGNVARVLCRLDGIRQDPRRPAVREKLWKRAEQLLPQTHCGDFNSALMELGATVCTPRSPKCLLCPVRRYCQAFAAGAQERIPPAAPRKARPLEERWTLCIRHRAQWLIEQRPAKGRWAGMWQFVTLPARPAGPAGPASDGEPTAELVQSHTKFKVAALREIGQVEHDLTHRRYRFRVFVCELAKGRGKGAPEPAENGQARAWTTLAGLSDYPLPRPHLRIAEMLERLQ